MGLYLAVDHVDDVFLGVVLAVAIPVTAFRFFTPNEVFPVAYRRGRTAHVNVTGARDEAIRQGVRDQLGFTVPTVFGVGLLLPFSNPSLRAPVCGTSHAMVLAAQAVPSAALPPCITALPVGWTAAGAEITSGKADFWLDSGQAGPAAVTITLTAACDTSGLALCGRGAACPG